MGADLRISIKDYHRNRNLKFCCCARQFLVRMNGSLLASEGRPLSRTRLLTAIRKSLVKPLAPLLPSGACQTGDGHFKRDCALETGTE